jgi:hypothetical protein
MGINQQAQVSEMLGISTEHISRVLKNFKKLYYCEIVKEYSETDAENAVEYYHQLVIKQPKLKMKRLQQDRKLIIYNIIGSRTILDIDVFKLNNFKVVNGKYRGKANHNFVDGYNRYSRQDVYIEDGNVIFKHNGNIVSKNEFVDKGIYTHNNRKIFVYVADKCYRVGNSVDFLSLNYNTMNTIDYSLNEGYNLLNKFKKRRNVPKSIDRNIVKLNRCNYLHNLYIHNPSKTSFKFNHIIGLRKLQHNDDEDNPKY